jgi:hypothetical protein
MSSVKAEPSSIFDPTQTCWCKDSAMGYGIYHHCKFVGGRMAAYRDGVTHLRGDPEPTDEKESVASVNEIVKN